MSQLAKFIYTDARVERLWTGVLGCWATIFTLHRPMPANGAYDGIDPDFLAECLSFARAQGYKFVSIDEMVERALKGESLSRCLCFTLDDGFADQLNELVPVLLHYGAKPTLYVISDLIDGTAWPWDNQLAHMCWYAKPGQYQLEVDGQVLNLVLNDIDSRKKTRRSLTRMAKLMPRAGVLRLLQALQSSLQVAIPPTAPKEYQPSTWQQLREYEAQGLRVGCHAKSHFTFSALTDEEIVSELSFAQSRLEAELANPSKVFCYPSGTGKDFSERHERLVQQAGFLGAVSTLSKNTCTRAIQAAPYRIQRIGMPQELNHFVRYISWFEYLRGRMA